MSADRWCHHTTGDCPHIWPEYDSVAHDIDDDNGGCICGPRVEPVMRADGSNGWVIIHHQLTPPAPETHH